ncbi:MAG: dephospho-CoA kinase [Actinomycetota bacterium]
MLLVGLTGGIGSGKSTVAALLAERGAVVIDADDLARRAVAFGTDGFDRVVETFGPEIVRPDGEIDRAKLAEIVFTDPARLQELEAIVHPEVARLLAEAIEPHRGTDRVIVYAVPLLAERGLAAGFDVVVVVVADVDRRIERLMRDRGMRVDEVRARVAAQLSDEERARVADVLLDNDGESARLVPQVNRLWTDLVKRAGAAR